MILVHYHEINLTGKSSNFVHHEFEGGRVTILAANDEEAKERAKQLFDGCRRAMAGGLQGRDFRFKKGRMPS